MSVGNSTRLPRLWLTAITAIVLGTAGCATGPAQGGSTSAPASPVASLSPGAAASPGTAQPAASSVAASSPAPASDGTVLHLAASQNITTNAPIWFAAQTGLFEKNGLNVDLQSTSATTAVKQLVAGQLDGLIAGAAESVSARAAGSPIQIVATLSDACDMLLVVPNSITSVDQLRGKTVTVITRASFNGICTIAYLRKNGLEPGQDYQILEAQQGGGGTYATVTAVLQAGVADAGAIEPDFARKLTDTGQFHTLTDLASEPGLQEAGSALTVTSASVQQHPQDLQKLVDALLQAQTQFAQNPDAAKDILRNDMKMTDETDIDVAYTRVVQQAAKDPRPRKELFPDVIDALALDQPAVRDVDLDTFLDPQFAQDAMNRGLANN